MQRVIKPRDLEPLLNILAKLEEKLGKITPANARRIRAEIKKLRLELAKFVIDFDAKNVHKRLQAVI